MSDLNKLRQAQDLLNEALDLLQDTHGADGGYLEAIIAKVMHAEHDLAGDVIPLLERQAVGAWEAGMQPAVAAALKGEGAQ